MTRRNEVTEKYWNKMWSDIDRLFEIVDKMDTEEQTMTTTDTDGAATRDELARLLAAVEAALDYGTAQDIATSRFAGMGDYIAQSLVNGREAFTALAERTRRLADENERLQKALEEIRDYDIAVNSKYGIEDLDEQARAMWVMRKKAKVALLTELGKESE